MPGVDLRGALESGFQTLGPWAYALLFAAFFFQTATPLGAALPGNPLVFVLGLLAKTSLGVSWAAMAGLIACAASLGAFAGYLAGRRFGPRIAAWLTARLGGSGGQARLEAFFARHGTRAVAAAFLVPFARNFAPTFAGCSGMPFRAFALSSLAGSALWSILFVGAGYAFGEIPWVEENLELALLGVAAVLGLRVWLVSRRRAAA
jgi:membrane-associated protein